MPFEPPSASSFSFTAASLRPELAALVAERALALGDWQAVKKDVLTTNALQCRSSASAVRLEREMRQRLHCLTAEQIAMLARADSEERALLAWLATVKKYRLLFELSSGLLRSKLEVHDPVLRSSDYSNFLEHQTLQLTGAQTLTGSSLSKIRNVALLMLREAGLLQTGADLGIITRPVISRNLEQAIRADHPGWLSTLLVPEKEIPSSS
jgi:hypothetical protein